MTKVTGRLVQVERLNSSRMGNPRFEVTLNVYPHSSIETYRTGVDCAVGYDVSNHKLGSDVTLTLSPKGAVVDMVAAP